MAAAYRACMRFLSSLLLTCGVLGLVGGLLFNSGFMGPLALLAVGAVLRMAFGDRAPAAAVERESPSTHVRCPDCRELVRWDASKCKHCGSALKPWQAPPDQPQPASAPPPRVEEWRG